MRLFFVRPRRTRIAPDRQGCSVSWTSGERIHVVRQDSSENTRVWELLLHGMHKAHCAPAPAAHWRGARLDKRAPRPDAMDLNAGGGSHVCS